MFDTLFHTCLTHQHDDEYHRHLMKKSSRRDLTVSGLSEEPQLNVSCIISTCLLCLLVTMHLLITDIEDTFENAQWGKAKQMQSVWLCILSHRKFWNTVENTQWRKAKQMQPMWFCILSGRQFETTFENAQWRKVKQMQAMRLCLFTGKPFEKTFENT